MCLCVASERAEATSKLRLQFEYDYVVQTHRSLETLMLISHKMLSLRHSCCAKRPPLGVDYVSRPAAGVESKGRKGRKPSLMSAALDV